MVLFVFDMYFRINALPKSGQTFLLVSCCLGINIKRSVPPVGPFSPQYHYCPWGSGRFRDTETKLPAKPGWTSPVLHSFRTRHLPTPFSVTMLSGILIFNQKGENLIFRAFRNDCRPRLADVFRIQVISNAQVRSPILTLGSTTFSHVKHENIYLVAITKSNANAALVFEFLYRFIALGKGYFGKFDEEAVKNNFVLVYELLDGTQHYRFNITRRDTDNDEQRLSILGIRKTQRPTH